MIDWFRLLLIIQELIVVFVWSYIGIKSYWVTRDEPNYFVKIGYRARSFCAAGIFAIIASSIYGLTTKWGDTIDFRVIVQQLAMIMFILSAGYLLKVGYQLTKDER